MDEKVCFVIMGFGSKTDYSIGKTMDLDKTYKHIIKPVAEKCGYRCIRSDEIKHSSIIDKYMYGLLLSADLVIADISTYNPNAIYELGIRHALKPFHTIILKDKEGTLPFDLDHINILHYKHLGEDIGVEEAGRCKDELERIIITVQDKSIIDSPFYEYIRGVEPPKVSVSELESIIANMEEREPVFYIAEKAKELRKEGKFEQAAEYWKMASEKVPSEPYYIQQQAFCLYKSQKPSVMSSLNNALKVIDRLLTKEECVRNDPETLGIAGAICKNLYLQTKDISRLDEAIEHYKVGYINRKDYYNGENYALCLNIKSVAVEDEEEKIYNKVQAKKVREEIAKILTNVMESKDFHNRNDKKWIYATLANCHFALGCNEKGNEYEESFKQSYTEEWELQTYNNSKRILLKLLKGEVNF